MVEDRPILSAEYRLLLLAKTDPPCSAVSAIAELLVMVPSLSSYNHSTHISGIGRFVAEEIILSLLLAECFRMLCYGVQAHCL